MIVEYTFRMNLFRYKTFSIYLVKLKKMFFLCKKNRAWGILVSLVILLNFKDYTLVPKIYICETTFRAYLPNFFKNCLWKLRLFQTYQFMPQFIKI